MVKIVEYGTYIIDVSTAILDYRKGLTREQIEILTQIHDRSVCFVTSCFQHESSDLMTLYYFLGGQARRFVMMITNHSEFLQRDRKLHPAYRDAIEQIIKCIHAVREELEQMKKELVVFMEKIGMKVPMTFDASDIVSKSRRKFEATEGEIPAPTLPQPQKRIKRLKPKPNHATSSRRVIRQR